MASGDERALREAINVAAEGIDPDDIEKVHAIARMLHRHHAGAGLSEPAIMELLIDQAEAHLKETRQPDPCESRCSARGWR